MCVRSLPSTPILLTSPIPSMSMQLAIYDSWFDPMLKTLPTLVPNGFIYLRAKPDTCFRRMQKRSRNEESTVELEYLEVRAYACVCVSEGVRECVSEKREGRESEHVCVCVFAPSPCKPTLQQQPPTISPRTD